MNMQRDGKKERGGKGREETKEEARTCSHSDLSTGLIAKRAISGKPPVWHMTLNLYLKQINKQTIKYTFLQFQISMKL